MTDEEFFGDATSELPAVLEQGPANKGLVVQQHRDSSQIGELAHVAAAMPPRDLSSIMAMAKQVGAEMGRQLTEQGASIGFYSFRMGGSNVEGPSIALMNTLAGMYGRLIAQVHVLDYDPSTRQAMLRARVVDLASLRAEEIDHPCTIPPAPGKFAAKPDQAQRWLTMQLRAQGSRAKRNALEQIIPAHIVNVAMQAAKASYTALTLKDQPLTEARAAAARYLGEELDKRLTVPVLEAYLGTPVDEWRAQEIGALRVLINEIRRGVRPVQAILASVEDEVAQAKPVGRLEDLGIAPAPEVKPAPQPKPRRVPVDPMQRGNDIEATPKGPDRDELMAELLGMKRRILSLDDSGNHWKEVQERSGVSRITTRSSVERLEKVREAAQDVLKGLEESARGALAGAIAEDVIADAAKRSEAADEEIADSIDDGDDEGLEEPIINPTSMKLDNKGRFYRAFLDNVYAMERVLGEGLVTEIRKALLIGNPTDLINGQLRAYAQELYGQIEDGGFID